MQLFAILILFTLISFTNGYAYHSNHGNCKQFENKYFRFSVSISNKTSYRIAHFRSNGLLDIISNGANGNNLNEFNTNLKLSDAFGTYKCLHNNMLRLTSIGYVYKTKDVEGFEKNGAIVLYDALVHLKHRNKAFKGVTQSAFFKHGDDLFSNNVDPIFETDIAEVKGDMLEVRACHVVELNKID